MQELSEKDGKLEIGQDGMKHMMEEAAQYFPESHIVGWGIVDWKIKNDRERSIKKLHKSEEKADEVEFDWI